jgi:hypothetical protein
MYEKPMRMIKCLAEMPAEGTGGLMDLEDLDIENPRRTKSVSRRPIINEYLSVMATP